MSTIQLRTTMHRQARSWMLRQSYVAVATSGVTTATSFMFAAHRGPYERPAEEQRNPLSLVHPPTDHIRLSAANTGLMWGRLAAAAFSWWIDLKQ